MPSRIIPRQAKSKNYKNYKNYGAVGRDESREGRVRGREGVKIKAGCSLVPKPSQMK